MGDMLCDEMTRGHNHSVRRMAESNPSNLKTGRFDFLKALEDKTPRHANDLTGRSNGQSGDKVYKFANTCRCFSARPEPLIHCAVSLFGESGPRANSSNLCKPPGVMRS